MPTSIGCRQGFELGGFENELTYPEGANVHWTFSERTKRSFARLGQNNQADLPESEMTQQEGGFGIKLFKNKLTPEQITKLGFNERQVKAVLFLKGKGRITNKEYHEIFRVTRMTATRSLTEFVEKGILKSSKTKGAVSYYEV